MSQPTNDTDKGAVTQGAEKFVDAVATGLDPTAPSQPASSGVVVDFPEVVPNIGISSQTLLLIGLGSGALFTVLAIAVGAHSLPTITVDGDIHRWVVAHRGALDVDFARMVTWGGATIVTIPALAVIGALAVKGPKRLSSRIGSGVLLAGVASVGMYVGLSINALMGGQRPDTTDWLGSAGGPTFPSGHTTSATIFAGACLWAIAPRLNTSRTRVLACSAAVAYAVLVGSSRVWLGVHWPSDVLGGWLFGVAWVALAESALIFARQRFPRPSVKGSVK
ncbi:MAG: phosphatase PAP2 family protein [Actinomycetota bacterium]|nr:phosphatase PAP2 family protein [Actinomycetota bacterium]